MRTKTLEFTVYGLKSNEVERKSIFFFVTTETNTGPMGQFCFIFDYRARFKILSVFPLGESQC